MQAVNTLIEARWVVPIEPTGVVLENHSVVIDDGHIVALQPTATARERYVPHHHYTFPHHALLPGLVNGHTHAAMSLLRGVADDLPLMEWLQHHIWPAEQRWVDATFVRDGTALAIAEMIRGGTTCFNDMYFFPEESAKVAAESGIRAVVGLLMIDFPTAWGEGPDHYLEKGLALHSQLQGQPRLHTTLAPHAPYTVSDEPLQRLQRLSEQLELPVHMHIHETADEVESGQRDHGCRPLQRLQQLGLINSRLAAVHMTQLTSPEIELLASTGASVIHCPESNLKLASGFCPVHALHQAGVNIALGTDGAASNNDLDLLGEMRTAALLAKGSSGDASAVPAHQALRMATLNGARALGLERQIGSLKVGKAADLIAVDLGRLENQPLYDVASQLVYASSRHQVDSVWVEGRQLLHQGELTTLDGVEVVQRAQEWRSKIAP